MATKILIIEDDKDTGDTLEDALRRKGHDVTLCRDGEDGFFQAITAHFDLLILDVVLPCRSGLEILVGLRKHNARIPVLMLSSRNEVDDRVAALSHDADDYLGKPFALKELLARVQVMLRRTGVRSELKLRVADLNLDLMTRGVVRAGRPIILTLREYEMLEFLMRQAGRVISRALLAQNVWKNIDRVTPLDNVIDVHMSRLRRKIDGPGLQELLHTVRGIGYRLGDQAYQADQPSSATGS